MKEITYKDWIKNPTPRMMLVWDDGDIIQKKFVIYIHPEKRLTYKVIALDRPTCSTTCAWAHCAEIAEIEKPRTMTYQELSWWLLSGIKEGKCREWRCESIITNPTIHSYLNYSDRERNMPVENVLIRENGGEWRKPLTEVEE